MEISTIFAIKNCKFIFTSNSSMEMLFRISGNKLECLLCPHFCKIGEGKTGICGVRKNTGEKIELLTYGVISGYSLDPVEKKPLYHFFPGNNVLSIGSYGCNLRCDFCQNYNISQNISNKFIPEISPEELLKNALSANKNIGVAFTYNEPVIWFEFVKDVALLIKKSGLYTVMVTNGFVNTEPLSEYLQFVDAFNVDLKAFNNDFYKSLTGAKIKPVKDSIKMIKKAERHLEITTLIITGQNDSESQMEQQVKWIADEIGTDVPFHLSRYFPMFKRTDPTTPHYKLQKLFDIACKHLRYVYLGNTLSESGQDTRCTKCDTLITKRSGYYIQNQNVTEGKCTKCGTLIYKYFTSFSS
jgi:pyruvate formate lyase activating enzyme